MTKKEFLESMEAELIGKGYDKDLFDYIKDLIAYTVEQELAERS